MLKLILLLKKIHFVLLFLILETVALYTYLTKDEYHAANTMLHTANVTATIDANIADVYNYFQLGSQNQSLRDENAALYTQLLNQYVNINDSTIKTLSQDVIVLQVVKNSFTKQQNYITLKGGAKQGVVKDMALFDNNGIIGYVLDVSDNYSIAISILNTLNFNTSGKLKGTDYVGSITWNGENYRTAKLTDMSKYAELQTGDTIMTTQYSNIFPENMPIGTVHSIELKRSMFYEADIDLFADLSSIRYVYAVSLQQRTEREKLENSIVKEKTK